MCSKYSLELKKEGDMLYLEGEERSRRHMLSSIVYEELHSDVFGKDALQKAFPDIDLAFIETAVLNLFSEFHYFVSEYAVTEILLETAIAIDRIMEDETIETLTLNGKLPVPEPALAMSKKLCEELESYFNIFFEQGDIADMAVILFTQASTMTLENDDDKSLPQSTEDETAEIMEEMLRRLTEDYGITIEGGEAKKRFSMHLKKMILRAKTKHFNHNPITESLKRNCPLVYDVAVSLCSVLVEKLSLYITDDEIAYVAFHIGHALEENRDYQSRIKVVLNCPSYISNAQLLQDRLLSRLKKDIYLMGITFSEKDLEEYSDADLVLSACQLKDTQKEHLLINPFFSGQDMILVEQAIERIRKDRKTSEFYKALKNLTFPEFYEHINCSMSREETIHYICTKLCAKDFCRDSFEIDVLEREKLSSTGFGNFAMPHTLKMREKKSCLYILINDTPVLWDNMSVQLILLLSFRAEDRKEFNNVFELMTEALLNRKKMRALLNTHFLEEFIDIMIE